MPHYSIVGGRQRIGERVHQEILQSHRRSAEDVPKDNENEDILVEGVHIVDEDIDTWFLYPKAWAQKKWLPRHSTPCTYVHSVFLLFKNCTFFNCFTPRRKRKTMRQWALL